MKRIILSIASVLFLAIAVQSQTTPPGPKYQPIVLNPAFEHTKWGIEPADLLYNFAAYTTSFDSDDDNNGDGKSDLWGVPEWVAYEVKKEKATVEDYNRPPWMTDDALAAANKAPNDATYAVQGTNRLKEVSGDYRFVRGHMCPKDVADRISMEAGFNTHTILNAVPQLQWQNNGIWKNLEKKVTEWADKYERVWVICGPIYFDKTPAIWLGQDGEVKAAVADAFYKIVIREAATETGIETLTFIIPNVIPKGKKDFYEFLTTMKRVEELTGLTFLTKKSATHQSTEKKKNSDLTSAKKKSVVDKWQ